MTIKMYRWDIKKWEKVGVVGTQGVQPSVWKPWTWANQSLHPSQNITMNPEQGTITGHTPYTNIQMPEDDGSYRNITGEYQNPEFGEAVQEAPVPGRGTPEGRGVTAEFASHRSPGQQVLSRFSDQASFSDLWRQQQKWLKDLHANRQGLPPGFAAAQGLPEGTTPQDLLRFRDQHGRAPPALGGAGGSKQNPYTLYTDQGKRDIHGPIGSRIVDNVDWLAGLGNRIPGSAGWRERKHFANQAAGVAGAMRNMLTRGRNNPNYAGNESDRRILWQAMGADLLPRMGYPEKDIKWIKRVLGGGPERLQAEKDKLGRMAVREHKKTVNPLDEHLKANYTAGSMREEIARIYPHFNEKDRKTWPRADGKASKGLIASDLRRVYHARGDPHEYARLLAEEKGEDPQSLVDEKVIAIEEAVNNNEISPEQAEGLIDAIASQHDVFGGKWGAPPETEEELMELIDSLEPHDPQRDIAQQALAEMRANRKLSPEEYKAIVGERGDALTWPGIASKKREAILSGLAEQYANPNVTWDDAHYGSSAAQYITEKVAPHMGIARGEMLKIVNRATKGDEGAQEWLDNLLHLWGAAAGPTAGIDPSKFAKSTYETPMDMAWAVLKLG